MGGSDDVVVVFVVSIGMGRIMFPPDNAVPSTMKSVPPFRDSEM